MFYAALAKSCGAAWREHRLSAVREANWARYCASERRLDAVGGARAHNICISAIEPRSAGLRLIGLDNLYLAPVLICYYYSVSQEQDYGSPPPLATTTRAEGNSTARLNSDLHGPRDAHASLTVCYYTDVIEYTTLVGQPPTGHRSRTYTAVLHTRCDPF